VRTGTGSRGTHPGGVAQLGQHVGDKATHGNSKGTGYRGEPLHNNKSRFSPSRLEMPKLSMSPARVAFLASGVGAQPFATLAAGLFFFSRHSAAFFAVPFRNCRFAVGGQFVVVLSHASLPLRCVPNDSST
jgi:hypothetical protein